MTRLLTWASLALTLLFALPAQAIQITGTFVAGPALVVESVVGAYPISNGQVTTQPISVYVTKGAGQFVLTVPPSTPVLVVGNFVPNGRYDDPVLGRTEQLSTIMRAVLVTGTSDMALTLSPISEAAAQVVLGETSAQAPAPLTEALIRATQAKAQSYLLSVDPLATTPFDATSAAAMAGASPAQRLLAVALAGISYQRSATGQTLSAVIQNVAQLIQAGWTLLDAGGGFSADPDSEPVAAMAPVQNAIGSFVNSTQNRSGVASLYDLAAILLGGGPRGGTPGAPWTQACIESVTADFAIRDAIAQSPLAQAQWRTISAYGNLAWGPSPTIYPAVTIPAGCDPVTWQQQRLLAAANHFIQQQHNYCHHYIPGWNSAGLTFPQSNGPNAGPGPSYCYTGSGAGVAANAATQTGLDCSNYTSWLYNYALGGVRMTGGITAQGGSLPTADRAYNYGNAWAPGTLYERPAQWQSYITKGQAQYQQYPFQPGDLLYVGPTAADAAKGKISHVVMWTGIQAADGSGRYLVTESFGAIDNDGVKPQAAIPNRFPFSGPAGFTGAAYTGYLNNAGPNLRYFEGTFRATNLVHYRRIINAPSGFYTIPYSAGTGVEQGRLAIDVTIAGAPAGTVTASLDTGSRGFWVTPGLAPAGSAASAQSVPGYIFYWSSGHVRVGYWTPMAVTFPAATALGGATGPATATIPVLVATLQGCVVGTWPNASCTDGTLSPPTVQGAMMGIGFDRTGHGTGYGSATPDPTGPGTTANLQILNPFLNLDQMKGGTMRSGYILGTGGITLGLTAANTAQTYNGARSAYAYTQLKPTGRPAVAGAPTDWLPMTGAVTLQGKTYAAAQAVLDIGIPNMLITLGNATPFAGQVTAGNTTYLSAASGTMDIDLQNGTGRVGYSIAIPDPGAVVPPNATLRPANVALSPVQPVWWTNESRDTLVNTGIYALNAFNYLYDAQDGLIGLQLNATSDGKGAHVRTN